MAVTFDYNINAGYFDTSTYDSESFIVIRNDTSDDIYVSSISFYAGTGNAHYNYGASIQGNGGNITLYGVAGIAAVARTDTVTIDTRIGSSYQIIDVGDEIGQIRYYPTYSQCQYYTLYFQSPLFIEAGDYYNIFFHFGGSGNCFVWRRDTVTGSYSTSSGVYGISYNLGDGGYWNTILQYGSPITGTDQIRQFSASSSSVTSWYMCNASHDIPLNGWNEGDVPTGQSHVVGHSTNIVANPIRSGWEFYGWDISNMTASYHGYPAHGLPNDFSGSTSYTLLKGPDPWYEFVSLRNTPGIVSFTALWSPIITYNSNGGSGTISDQVANYTGNTTLNSGSSLSKTNYHLVEWNTAADGTGTSYALGASIPKPSAPLSLYAIWASDATTITYNANYSGGGTSTTTKIPGTVYTLPGDVFTRSGYKLIGWNIPANGSTAKYAVGDSYTTPNSSVTLYAVWYENFKWTSNDTTNIAAGKPTTNALASKFNTLQDNIHNYVDSSFTKTTVSSKQPMTATIFNAAATKLEVANVSAGAKILANKFTAMKTAINNQARYLK